MHNTVNPKSINFALTMKRRDVGYQHIQQKHNSLRMKSPLHAVSIENGTEKYNQETLLRRVSNMKNTVIMQSKQSKINGIPK